MVKQYWELNKKSYYILCSLGILLLALLGCIYIAPYLVENIENILNESASLRVVFALLMFVYGLLFGGSIIGVFVYEIFLCIKPFRKQQQLLIHMGIDVPQYILTHVLVLLGTTIVWIVIGSLMVQQSAIGIDIINFIENLLSSLTFPLIIVSMCLFIGNGQLLPQAGNGKRRFIIIFTYIILLLIMNGIVTFFDAKELLSVNLTEQGATANIVSVTYPMKLLMLRFGMHAVEIFVFILAYYSYRKHYEIKY